MYKILIVEDEEVIRKGLIMSINFEKLNCVLIGEATNGIEGIEQIKKARPDIVITDISMPLMNGIEMIEKTSAYSYSSIIISGYNEFAFAKKAIRYGVCDYLLKPIDRQELEDAILQVIEQQKVLHKYQVMMKQKGEINNIQLLSTMNSDDALVEKMIAYVKENYMQKISMITISEYLNYSESLLTKRFKRSMNITFNDYLNRFRVQKAIEFIKQQSYPMTEIAIFCGFSDYKYFSVVFKKYTSCSPKQFVEIVSKQQAT